MPHDALSGFRVFAIATCRFKTEITMNAGHASTASARINFSSVGSTVKPRQITPANMNMPYVERRTMNVPPPICTKYALATMESMSSPSSSGGPETRHRRAEAALRARRSACCANTSRSLPSEPSHQCVELKRGRKRLRECEKPKRLADEESVKCLVRFELFLRWNWN